MKLAIFAVFAMLAVTIIIMFCQFEAAQSSVHHGGKPVYRCVNGECQVVYMHRRG